MNKSIYIRHLDKYEVKVFTMQEQILFAAELRYHILEGWTITPWHGTDCELVNGLGRRLFRLKHDHATKSRAWNHGDLQYGRVYGSCRCDHLYLLC